MELLEEISKPKLVKYKVKFSKREDGTQTFPQVTNMTPTQRKYFNMVGIRNVMSLEKIVWRRKQKVNQFIFLEMSFLCV